MKRHIFAESHMEKCHLRNVFLESKKIFEIGGKCFIVSGDGRPWLLITPIY